MNIFSASVRLGVMGAVCGVALLLSGAGVARAQPRIVDIGVAAGGPDSFVSSLSRDGLALAATCNCSPQRALRWTEASGLVVLPQGSGVSSSASFGISGDGTRETGSLFVTSISGRVPAYWNGVNGPFSFLLPPGWSQGYLNATNDDGTYHVGAVQNSLSGPTTACRLSTVAANVVIPVPGFASSVATVCSADGQRLAGTATTPGTRAFWWNSGALMLLPLAPGAVDMRSFGISRDGGMVVGGGVQAGNVHKAFKWSIAGGSEALDTVDPSLETQATSVSADGSVIFGNSVYTVATGGALVWVDGQAGIALRDYLAARGLDTTGWRLDGVAGVSIDGSTMAGGGMHNGQTRGFVIQNLPSVCAPVVLTQPDPALANSGGTASFSVAAAPSGVAYAWYHDGGLLSDGPTGTGSTVSGAATATVTVSNVSASDAGSYWCQILNACGGAVSNPAGLTVSTCGTVTETMDCGATCTGEGQECGLLFEVVRDTCGDFRAEYTTSPTHCSNVGMRFFVDGVLRVETPPVGPGVSTGVIDFGPLPSGPHTLGMEGVGEEGGCNTGFLGDWAGTLALTYCVAPPEFTLQPVGASACPAGSVSYSIASIGGGPPSLEWQISDPLTLGDWRTIPDGETLAGSGSVAFTASGAGTPNLTIAFGPGFTDDWSGEAALVRCIVTNACGGVTSDEAGLRWCYANCDCSTVAPVLNANDFQCFLNQFAAGDPAANCDGSSVPPVLNANDFQCFLNRFAAGCS